ncbi:MAG TPA: 5-(carboxyamino)imidazole ribonucleotide synthase [Steroidobacteraceae bacterium]|jgi:5-(carboxyamino)imidazole ribonucleotide synthase|nr:5-(carboxyamino)imidazole ribonucleotide synthase [Steroidobacteraceae bacterium]
MTIGIVGAGQLGRMMALAGYPLGFDFLFLDRDARTPGGQVGPILAGELTDRDLLGQLSQRCEVLTFDWENIPVEALEALPGKARIAPPLRALAAAQDRLTEKRTFELLGIATTKYAAVDSRAALELAVKAIGLPGVLKTRRMGYDGKGQFVLRKPADLDRAWEALGKAPLLYENLVPFDAEVSVIAVRGADGEAAFYPLNLNVHRDGILRLTRAPYGNAGLTRQAQRAARKLLEHFEYVGVLTIEFFVKRGKLIANEMAPRVHNSGHWTIEGADTSQFENHVRAIAGLPLGSTKARGHSAMINLVGEMPTRDALLAEPGLHWHDYGKTARPGRKLGHVTICDNATQSRNRRAFKVLSRIDRATYLAIR